MANRADPRHLLRLRRLEKVRAIAKDAAAREAAEAESTLAQLDVLAARIFRRLRHFIGFHVEDFAACREEEQKV